MNVKGLVVELEQGPDELLPVLNRDEPVAGEHELVVLPEPGKIDVVDEADVACFLDGIFGGGTDERDFAGSSTLALCFDAIAVCRAERFRDELLLRGGAFGSRW
jgi:hypothetical protein